MESRSSTPVAWIAAAIRFIAMWTAIDVLILLPTYVAQWRTPATYFDEQSRAIASSALLTGVMGAVSALVVAGLVWTTSHALAERIWRPVDGDDETSPLLEDVQRAFFAALGVYLIVNGLPRIVTLAYRYYSLPPRFGLTEDFQWNLVTGAISGGIAVAAGLALFFGASGLTNLLHRSRHPADDDSEVADELEEDDAAPEE
jgi:hypothetical protein